MSDPDFNLLVQLDVLLAEGNVARAAKRLRLSPSAMSRALARLRDVTGDPLLVRAGRALVPTPRAVELRERVARLVDEGRSVLRPAERVDPRRIERSFTIRSAEGFAETFGARLVERARTEAPSVRLHFVTKADKDGSALRDGLADAETGVVDEGTSPELRTRELFRDRLVGVVRAGHTIRAGGVTIRDFEQAGHVVVRRRGLRRGPLDGALADAGVELRTAVTVSGFAAAIALARSSDLVATVPEIHTIALREGMHTFELPFRTAEFSVALLWHPRQDADPAQRWLRQCIRESCDEVVEAAEASGSIARRPRDAATPR